MKAISLIFTAGIILFSLPSFSQSMCADSLLPQGSNPMASAGEQDDIQLPDNLRVARFESYVDKIDFYRKYQGNTTRTTVLHRDQRMARLNHYLSIGDRRAATALLSEVFYSTELATRILQSDLPRDELFQKYEKTFGENYSDYVYFRKFLAKVLDPKGTTRAGNPFNVDYKAHAQSVLDSLGVPANEFGSSFDETRINKARPSIEEVEAAFYASPNAVEAKLKRDLAAERYSALRGLFSSLMLQDAMQSALAKSYEVAISRVPYLKEPFRFIVKSFRDSTARKIDIYKIKKILMLKTTVPEKLNVLRSMYSAEPNRTLLVSFSRFDDSEIHSAWNALKTEAETQSKNDAFSKDFYDKMINAEKIGLDYGTISEYYPPAPMDQMAGWIVTGTTFSTVLYHQFAPHSWAFWQTIDSIFKVLGHH